MSNNNNVSPRDLKIMFKYIIGTHVEKIANQEKVSTATIYKVLKKNNIPLKNEKEVRKYFYKKVFTKLVKEKKTVKQISREMEIPEEVVNGYINYEFSRISKEKKKSKGGILKVRGLDSQIGNDDRDIGMKISNTDREKKKRASLEEGNIKGNELQLNAEVSDDEKENIKMVMLRELLRYASEVSGLPDYSKDPLLVSDYLLPVDLVIMKDISARFAQGEEVVDIAKTHRTDEDLVVRTIERGIKRNEFRTLFIKSLVKRGLIQM